MERVKLTLEVEPELRRRIKVSAAAREESLREWVYRAILRELENGEDELDLPPTGVRPRGLSESEAPGSRSGRPVSDAVVEDRR